MRNFYSSIFDTDFQLPTATTTVLTCKSSTDINFQLPTAKTTDHPFKSFTDINFQSNFYFLIKKFILFNKIIYYFLT